jgi:Dinucleotide-utilizing enzymes involved in molybdopterin and thiamine biosynthesis family 2
MTIISQSAGLHRWFARLVATAIRRFWGPRGLHRRLELAWTGEDRGAMEGLALTAAPREGAVIALCRPSTGATRDTLIVSEPLPPRPGDLSYRRGYVVTVTSRYWNRAIDALIDAGPGAGLAVLHTHPGEGVPEWSDDDDSADEELARFLFGEGYLPTGAPLLSLVASHSDLRGRALSLDRASGAVRMRPIERVRTLSQERIEIVSTLDRVWPHGKPEVPEYADRSIRVFGKEGQLLLADVHLALVGAGGVGSICGEHVTRWGIGRISIWDPDVVKDVNVNRSGVFTFAHAARRTFKALALARALPRFALAPNFSVSWSSRDVRHRGGLAALLDADVILMLVDDARPRHFINRLAYAHYIPVLDGGNAIRSTAEDDAEAESATVEGGAVRVSYLTPGGACLWCAGHLTAHRLSLAYRPDADKAADRARGYVEHLGPEHAPSVMPVNSITAALIEHRLQDLLLGLSYRAIPELYFDLLGGTLDELRRLARPECRNCARWRGRGDEADLPFEE